MEYKIEAFYIYGWDDAEWTQEIEGVTTPLRFQTVADAQKGLDEFFAGISEAVVAGQLDTEENQHHYRIVVAN